MASMCNKKIKNHLNIPNAKCSAFVDVDSTQQMSHDSVLLKHDD